MILPQNYIEGISVFGTPSILLYFGDGTGQFTDESYRINGMPPLPAYGVTITDLDQDGDQDLLVAVYGIPYGDGTIDLFDNLILLNDGNHQFFEGNASFTQPPLSPTLDFIVTDFEKDGRLDMIECSAQGLTQIWHQR